jgi:hypothetical protein
MAKSKTYIDEARQKKIINVLLDVQKARVEYTQIENPLTKLEKLKLVKDAVVFIGNEAKECNRTTRNWIKQHTKAFYRKHKIMKMLREGVAIEADLYYQKFNNLAGYVQKLNNRNWWQRLTKKYEAELEQYL